MAKLEVDNLQKSFGLTKVLDQVSFSLSDGKLLSILGPSGCGKSTILRIISGFLVQDSGRVLVDGKDITNLTPDRREIGMVFQSYALFPHMNVYQNVAYGLRTHRVPKSEMADRIDQILGLTRLKGMEKRRIQQLSGGQQQRVALARALVLRPKILLLDEPLSALDRKIRGEMQYEIRNIQQEVGITTVFVTHDQEEALTLSDQVILLNEGHIEQMADPWHIYNQPASLFASDFLGRANIITGTLVHKESSWFLDTGDFCLTINHSEGFQPGQKVRGVIRAEHIRLLDSVYLAENQLSGIVLSNIFTGTVSKMEIAVHNTTALEVIALSPHVAEIKPGMPVKLGILPADIHCFPIREEP